VINPTDSLTNVISSIGSGILMRSFDRWFFHILRQRTNIRSATFVLLFALVFMAGLSNAALASVVTSISGGTIIAMPNTNSHGAGPQTFGTPTITWTSTQSDAIFGYSGSNAFGTNGTWSGLIEAATNSTGSMTFTFSSPVHAVGGFITYAQNFNDTNMGQISVFDASHALIESDSFFVVTPGASNAGIFIGFSESALISSFTLTGLDIAITNLTVASPVPEPSASAMMILGFVGIGFLTYRRRSAGLRLA
jgi:PEP-CTERM motif